MKNCILTNKLMLCFLSLVLFASCAKEELAMDAQEEGTTPEVLSAVKSWTLEGNYYPGQRIKLWADFGVPKDWIVHDRKRESDNGFPRLQNELIYMKNQNYGVTEKVFKNQPLPPGWVFTNPNDNSDRVWIRNERGPYNGSNVTFAVRNGETLFGGQSRNSPDGRYLFIMQTDGNAVLYDISGGSWRALWNSGTYNNPGARIVMQGDGNLVVYSPSNQALWNSGTWGNAGSQLALLNSGNLVIVDNNNFVIWQD